MSTEQEVREAVERVQNILCHRKVSEEQLAEVHEILREVSNTEPDPNHASAVDPSTLTLDEIKERIGNHYGWGDFEELIREEGYGGDDFTEAVGFPFRFAGSSRGSDHESYEWRWKFGNRLFGIGGYYNSWDSNQMDSISGFYELVETEKTVKVYERKQ